MSSLYNALFGTNPHADELLEALHLKDRPECMGRFRDIYLNADGTRIILYTRNGGNNREEYQYVFDDFKNMHPYYIRDWDDDYDNTFAYIEFKTPEEFQMRAYELATGKEPLNVSDKFKQLGKDMEAGVQNETVERALNVGKKIFDQMENSKSGGVILIDEKMGEK